MNTVRFIDYKQTIGEKHLGIITVLVNDIIYLKYKINSGKKGGYFPNPPSYKVVTNGIEDYTPAFLIESRMLDQMVEECIKSNINAIMNGLTPGVAQTQTAPAATVAPANAYQSWTPPATQTTFSDIQNSNDSIPF